MTVMQSGTQMVKLKAGSKGLVRLFYLDEHRSCIRWKPSRKSEKAKSEYTHSHSLTIYIGFFLVGQLHVQQSYVPEHEVIERPKYDDKRSIQIKKK